MRQYRGVTDDAAWADLRAKRDALHNHPGRVACQRWDALQRVHKVLVANEAELLAVIDAFERSEELAMEVMRNVGQTGSRDDFHDELFRRMHNYLSALKMLVDHTRNLVREYPGGVFVGEYRERVATIATAGRGPFLQKLRDYLIHYRIPPFGSTIHLQQEGPFVATVHLDRDAALEFHDWPPLARAFLESQPEKILLAPLIRDYSREVEDLYRWLYDQFYALHSKDIDWFNEMLVEVQGAQNTPGHPNYRSFEPPPPTL